jgi:hypothetical protein
MIMVGVLRKLVRRDSERERKADAILLSLIEHEEVF